MTAAAPIATAARSSDLRLLAATAAASGLAFLPLATLPWLTARLSADYQLSEAQAGGVATLQLSLLALSAIGLGAVVDRLPRRSLALACGAIVSAATAALWLLSPPTPLAIALLAVIGAAAGACSAVANSWLGAASEPSKQTASMWTLLLIWQAILWLIIPLTTEAWGGGGLFATIATNAIMFTLLLLLAPPTKPKTAEAGGETAPMHGAPALLMAAALLCTAAFWLRDSLVWSLAAQRADALDVDAHSFSYVLAAGATLGFLGPLSARLLGMRLGALGTLLIALVPVAVATTAIAAANLAPFYLGAFLFWSSTSTFAWTYVVGVLVLLDSSGRLAAICGGTVFAASALGPFIGGMLLERFSPGALPAAVLALTLVTFLAVTALGRAVPRKEPT